MKKIVLTGIDLKNYQGIDPFRDVDRTYRSASEAFKDATYACAIEKHKSDFRQGLEWFSELFMFFFWAGCAIALPVLFVLWLFR